MRKAAPLIIWSESNLANRSCWHHEAFLAKQNGQSHGKWVCLVHQETFLSKQHLWSQEALWCTQTVFLSKQVLPVITVADGEMLRRSKFLIVNLTKL